MSSESKTYNQASKSQPPEPTRTPVARHLVRGTALYAIANIGDKVISFFLLVPLYARFLTPAAYGIIALSDSIGQLIVRIFGLSMDDSLRRLYFQYVDAPEELKAYVSTVLWSVLATVLLMLVLSFSAIPAVIKHFAPNSEIPFYPFIAFSVGAAVGIYILQYRLTLFQVQSLAGKYLAISASSFAITSTCAITFVVVLQRGAYGMLLAKLVAATAMAAISLFSLRGFFRSSWRWRYLHETLALSLPLIPHYLSTYGLDVADRFILARYRPLAEVGIYSLAYTIGKAMYMVTLSVCQAWSPTFFALARLGDEAKQRLGSLSSVIAVFLTWIAMAGSLAVQIFIAYFLDARYQEAGRIAPWIIGSFLFQGLYAMSMLSAMQAKRSIFLFVSSFSAFGLNVLLNFLLAPRFGMYGSAYANLIAFIVIAILMYVFAQRLFYLPVRLWRINVSLAIYFCTLAVTQWKTSHLRIALNGVAFAIATMLLYQLSGHNLRTISDALRRRRPDGSPGPSDAITQ